ncbi:MAG: phosphotransferase [Pseudonocardiaceae bacterium]
MHGNFNPGNILVSGERITALIDVEAVGKGSRFNDLAALIAYTALWGSEPYAQQDLLEYSHHQAQPGELEISLAVVLAFVIGHHPHDGNSLTHKATELLHKLHITDTG